MPKITLQNSTNTFKSKRLNFREIRFTDAENIVRWRSNPETYIYFRNPKPISLEEHINWYENNYLSNPSRVDYIIIEKVTDTPVGIVGVSIVESSGEISYIIGETDFLQRGFGSEAVNAIVAYFTGRISVFTAKIHQLNIASIKVAEKCGFVFEKELEPSFLLYKKSTHNHGGDKMGMSNEQFDSYKTQLIRNLQRAQKEVAEEGKSETLDQIINDLESELKNP
ncbi:MAG: GNAT family N-acetyltransferase [Defluviitaleaceae bacterium]|nr:GNAT family N-acetyltransferase [Defluviitaleaceae bacterium]